MGQARLTRIDAVAEMAAAVEAFRNEAAAALESLDLEIRRALEWIHHDRREHWDHEVRRGWERITEARVQLQQAMTARRVDDHDPACIDEKKVLARAKRRLEIAQEKVEAVRHCTRAIDHAVDDYRGARTPLASWLESDAHKALAALRRMMDNLEDYLAQQTPHGESADVVLNPDGASRTPAAPPVEPTESGQHTSANRQPENLDAPAISSAGAAVNSDTGVPPDSAGGQP